MQLIITPTHPSLPHQRIGLHHPHTTAPLISLSIQFFYYFSHSKIRTSPPSSIQDRSSLPLQGISSTPPSPSKPSASLPMHPTLDVLSHMHASRCLLFPPSTHLNTSPYLSCFSFAAVDFQKDSAICSAFLSSFATETPKENQPTLSPSSLDFTVLQRLG